MVDIQARYLPVDANSVVGQTVYWSQRPLVVQSQFWRSPREDPI